MYHHIHWSLPLLVLLLAAPVAVAKLKLQRTNMPEHARASKPLVPQLTQTTTQAALVLLQSVPPLARPPLLLLLSCHVSPEALHERLAVQLAPDEHNLVDARLIVAPGLVTGPVADGLVDTLEHKPLVAIAL